MMEKNLDKIFPIMGVEHDAIISRQGDLTIAFKVELPEIFTLSDQEYEAFHHGWIKSLRMLPSHSIFHKQDWFVEKKYTPDFSRSDNSFLSFSSERFFNERPYLDHQCYIFLTVKQKGRKPSSSLLSNLLKRSIVPEELLHPKAFADFIDSAGQFTRILEDSGFLKMHRLTNKQLLSHSKSYGVIEQYCYLPESESHVINKDIILKDGIQIGDKYCQLYTLSDSADLPDRKSTRSELPVTS